MPHRCLSCNRIYADDAAEVLRGCPCGKATFLFMHADAPEVARGVSSPKEGQYTVDVAQLLLPTADTPVRSDTRATTGHEKDGAYDIDVRAALGMDERKE